MNIEDSIVAIRKSQVRITDHADEEAVDDKLTFDEIYYSVMQGEIIEDYPNDKPFPSCLIMGKNFTGEPIHSAWAIIQRINGRSLLQSTDQTPSGGAIGK